MALALGVLISSLTLQAHAADGPLTCYDFGGLAYPNNTQCQGSFTCCGGAGKGCTANRLCESSTGALIVPACSRFPWTTGCSNICRYSTGTAFLPRVAVCSDGSFCCDNDPSCCIEGRGIIMDGNGNVASTKSGTSTSSSSTAASTTGTTISTTSRPDSATASPSTTSAAGQQESGMSVGAKAGIGTGIALAVIIILGLVIALILNRRRLRRLEEQRQNGYSDERIASTSQSVPHQPPVREHPFEADSTVLHEMVGHDNRQF